MIGLGSNRMSVCRRGGMSVTQAGRGGMEWLAGGRMPDWVTPYSAQATAALKAQFPTQWPTIRDYGFAHPEIVGYMNAYAPEDAKIAYSLVPTLGYDRWLIGDGKAWIDTGWEVNRDMEYKLKAKCATIGGAYMGVRYSGVTGCLFGTTAMDFFTNARWQFTSPTPGTTMFFHVKDKYARIYQNGALYAERDYSSSDLSVVGYTLQLYEINTSGTHSASYNAGMAIADLEISSRGYLVPFELANPRTAAQCYPQIAQSAGAKGLIDLTTGVFHPNAKTGSDKGSFTISETPAS